jgi:hypothetical protein
MGTQPHKHRHNHKAYFILMSLEVGLIGIKYQGLNTNPFQQSSPTVFMCLTSLFCHTVTTMADMNLTTAIVIFHISGIVGCETLLWIILPVFWKWYIINLFLLLVTSFCFFNTICSIVKLFLPTHSTAADQPPKLEELQEAQP